MKNSLKKITVLLASTFVMMACGATNPSSGDQSGQTPASSGQQDTSAHQDSSVTPSSDSSEDSGSEEVGEKTEYIFEAECTDLGGKKGPGYSGSATERNMASNNGNGRAFVTYLYQIGCSVNFIIQSNVEVDNVVLKACMGGEFMNVLLDPTTYKVRIDSVSEDDLVEAAGAWDADFLNYYKESSEEHEITYIEPWECEEIWIPTEGAQSPDGFKEFKFTSNLKLYKGYTSISFITANARSDLNLGTMAAVAPVIDYLSLTTDKDVTLDMAVHKDNGQGTKYMYTK